MGDEGSQILALLLRWYPQSSPAPLRAHRCARISPYKITAPRRRTQAPSLPLQSSPKASCPPSQRHEPPQQLGKAQGWGRGSFSHPPGS